MLVAAVLVSAGTGSRFGGSMPKQFLPLLGRPVIRHAAEALLAHVSLLQPVGPREPIDAALEGLGILPPVAGGASRQASVRAGLEALAARAPDIVLVHDAARPCIPPLVVPALLKALTQNQGAVPALPVTDTLKRGDAAGKITATVSRDGLFRAQTPQAFRFQTLLRLHRAATGTPASDDAGLLEAAGIPVALVPGSEDNVKVTYPEDLKRIEQALLPALAPRSGFGFDVHAFAAGRRLVLCGVEIPHEQGLEGHSDADVGIHALCDAIYGALAEGDIGRHFPPTEPIWKDADSGRFLEHAAARIAARSGVLSNADLTIICERPKISHYADAMIARLSDLLHVAAGRISVKATTTEHLGFTGRGEGIAAQAIVTVLLPWTRSNAGPVSTAGASLAEVPSCGPRV